MGKDDGATDYLPLLLAATPMDMMGGFRPVPWLTPSTADQNTPLTWHYLDRNYILTFNNTLSF